MLHEPGGQLGDVGAVSGIGGTPPPAGCAADTDIPEQVRDSRPAGVRAYGSVGRVEDRGTDTDIHPRMLLEPGFGGQAGDRVVVANPDRTITMDHQVGVRTHTTTTNTMVGIDHNSHGTITQHTQILTDTGVIVEMLQISPGVIVEIPDRHTLHTEIVFRMNNGRPTDMSGQVGERFGNAIVPGPGRIRTEGAVDTGGGIPVCAAVTAVVGSVPACGAGSPHAVDSDFGVGLRVLGGGRAGGAVVAGADGGCQVCDRAVVRHARSRCALFGGVAGVSGWWGCRVAGRCVLLLWIRWGTVRVCRW